MCFGKTQFMQLMFVSFSVQTLRKLIQLSISKEKLK
jgi:hypothetical protein